MATPEDVKLIFESRLKDSDQEFHPSDLERTKDENYLRRVLMHCEKDAKEAANMLWDILVWRKTIGAVDINENTIRMDYVSEGIFFPRGRDIDGCLLLVFKSKMHFKGQKDHEELKKIVVYWLDRIEREEKGKKITMFFDMDGSGLSNMDMDLVKYLINVFKCFYPYFLNYIIVFNMPWVLSAAFKVVKTLLPAKAVERMKFVTKDTLKDVVAPEQALVCWGGKDNYAFEFVPENKVQNEHTPKKVTFAEQGDGQHSPGEMLRVVPNDTIVFKEENDDISSQFIITNMDDGAVSFKIRTTSPDKYRVRPSSGCLMPGVSQTISIVAQPGFHLHTVAKDRFLVMSVQIPKMDLTTKELAEVWQNSTSSKVDEYRLRCTFPEKEITKIGKNVEKSPGKDSIADALQNLQANVEVLNVQVNKLKMFQYFTIILTGMAVILAYLVYENTNKEAQYCERM